jgi:hypothetical protein
MVRDCVADHVVLSFMYYPHYRHHILSSYLSCCAVVADGPFTLACLESADKNAQGSRGRIGFRQETGLERVSSGSDQLVVLGKHRINFA